MNIYELISRAQGLRQETKLDSVSPDRVGALCEDTLKYINEFQLLASSPSLHKIYVSVSAMQADAAPKSDLTGKALKPGQLVVIVPANQSDATAGDVYRYDGPSGNTSAWTFISKIGAVPADAELSATSENPVQNKVVTEKLTELSVKTSNESLDIIGATKVKIPSAPAYGWSTNAFPSLKKGLEYTIDVLLDYACESNLYWRLQVGESAIFTERLISPNALTSSIVYVADKDYDNVLFAVNAGAAKPSISVSIKVNTSEVYKLNQRIDGNSDSISQLQSNEKVLRVNDNVMMVSSKYFYASDNITDQATSHIVINGQKKGLVNGVKISIAKAGVIVLSFAENIHTNSPTFTELQRFDVVAGVNYLQLSNPITIVENSGIAVSPPSTALHHRPAREHTDDVGARYFNGSYWNVLNGIVMAVYTTDLSNVVERIITTELFMAENATLFKGLVDFDHYVTLLGSARFGKVTTFEKPTAPVFINGQESLIGKTIVGMKVSIAKAGTIVLCRAKNYRKSSPTFEKLQTFNVVEGENYLILNTPIVLEKNEAFGVHNETTASYHRGGYDSNYNKEYFYYNGSWNLSGADLVMAILTENVPINENSGADTDVEKTKDFTIGSSVYPITPNALYSHLFINKISLNDQPIIPSQSVIDVAIAAMLGFKMIELNINITSDGVAVTGHPVSGTLQTLADLNGNAVSVNVGGITFADLRNNYRYKSTYPQFRTPISSLEECLRECQRYGITPFVQCVNQSVVDLTESIVGKRYVAYGATRSQTNATICEFHSSGTIDDLVNRCKKVGYPYILGISSTLLDAWTDAEIKSLLSRVHADGCWVNWAGCYHTAESNMRMRKLGLDSSASGWEVPEFAEFDERKNGNAVKGFTDFTGTFTTSDNGAILSNGQTIQAVINKMGILAKGQLAMLFKGKVNISFGNINATFESDGLAMTIMTSVIEDKDANIVITAKSATTIYSIDYKTALVL